MLGKLPANPLIPSRTARNADFKVAHLQRYHASFVLTLGDVRETKCVLEGRLVWQSLKVKAAFPQENSLLTVNTNVAAPCHEHETECDELKIFLLHFSFCLHTSYRALY
jgi:hypothetical protein